jgi:hypothetical protein
MMIKPINSFNHDNFILNNKKIMYKIKIMNNFCKLKNECLKIVRVVFKK